MFTIPTGPIPTKYARIGSFLFGAASLVASFFVPAWQPVLVKVGSVLTALGITVGADK